MELEAYQKLESELANWIGQNTENVVVCSSGTAALHLALEALRVPLHERHNRNQRSVIVPNYTMVACPLAVSLSGMVPVLVDCSPNDLLMIPELVERAINKNTVAIMAVHTYGRLCDMSVINDIAKKYGLMVIEDMAEAHCSYPHPETPIACWSFYKNKIVHGEEGGCIYFKSTELARLARQLRNVGFTDEHDYTHIPRGHNYRMSNAHATLILGSLYGIEREVKQRRKLEREYDKTFPGKWKMPARETPWVYDIRIPGLQQEQQNRIIKNLRENGISARHGFKPMSFQSQFEHCRRVTSPHSLDIIDEIILLPLGSDTPIDTPKRAFQMIHQIVFNMP